MIEHYSKNIQNVIQTELFRAQKNIKIAVSWFTNNLLFQPLLLKQSMGVKVELIVNQDDINCGSSNSIDFADLVKCGGTLYWNASKSLMHDKFCIIDDNIVITGSYNWTNKAEYNEENISVFRGETDTFRFYNDQFNKFKKLYEITQSSPNSGDDCDIYSSNHFVSICKQYPYNKLNFVHGFFHIFSNDENSIIVVTKYADSTNKTSLISILDNNILEPILPFENEDRSHPNLKHGTIWLWKNHRAALYSVKKRAYLTNHMFDSVVPGLGHYIVHFNNHYGVCDVNGKLLLPCEYDSIDTTGKVQKGNKYGFFKSGVLYLECKYDEINIDGKKPSRIGTKYGLLSDGLMGKFESIFGNRGRIILDFEYDEIYFHGSYDYEVGNFFVMRKGNAYGFYIIKTGKLEPCIHVPRKDNDVCKDILFKRVTHNLYYQK